MAGIASLLFLPVLLTMKTMAASYPDVEIRAHHGRPTVFVDNQPLALVAYSPASWRSNEPYARQVGRFFPHRMGAYFVTVPAAISDDFFATTFWVGDEISSQHLLPPVVSLDDRIRHLLTGDPEAYLMIRFSAHEPASWRELHPDQLVVTECGKRLPVPSLASGLYNEMAARFSAAVIEHCESQPWAARVIGYANFLRLEGTHEPLTHHWLFDHSAVMTARWRQFLREKYHTVDNLRRAHGDPSLTFENAPVPRDKLRSLAPEVAALLYWQSAANNQPLRDYLLLMRDLFHAHFRTLSRTMQEALLRRGRKKILLYDALKQPMLGWSNSGFFDPTASWPLAFAEDRAGSGHLNVTALFDAPGMDGLITPHDYQARGVGGVYQPEGAADSAVLRGKLFLCEMDTRTYAGQDPIAPARDDREFAAVTWRNVADSLTRGYLSYWMDVQEDWFATEGIHEIIARQVVVMRQSLNWAHATVPGIALILDDEAVLETNGDGRFFNEAILWEQKLGLARCGVPFRIYLLRDLARDEFPEHRVFYFPNLFRADDQRLALLRKKVFRDDHVVVWGPGTGISDGERSGAGSATRLTGFQFELLPINYPRRVLISNFDHPLTRGLAADTVIGSPLAYGPLLLPKDGTRLGSAWIKQGRNASGLAAKEMDGWTSVFTVAAPLPAELWRSLARFAGAHIYCDSNDILLADSSLVALHSVQSGTKTIRLPAEFRVVDLVTGRTVVARADKIHFKIVAPETRVFLLTGPDEAEQQ